MIRILYLRAQHVEAVDLKGFIAGSGVGFTLETATNAAEYAAALSRSSFDLILTDHGFAGMSPSEVIGIGRSTLPDASMVLLSPVPGQESAVAAFKAGFNEFVSRDELWQLIPALRREQEKISAAGMNRGAARLVHAVQELSLARSLESIMTVVRHAARELTGADGATFILRDRDLCHYVDEDAIAPLWKGQRFPMKACISGWVMTNRKPLIIEDIYADPRVPIAAYRPTFVKSLAMVPIRTEAPIGAIGNYWAAKRSPTAQEIGLLQALANITSVALENVQVYQELEQRVKDRTAELQSANAGLKVANAELDSFSYAVSHDLAAPLRGIQGFAELALRKAGASLDGEGRRYLALVASNAVQMRQLIDDLLRLSRISRAELRREKVNLSLLAAEIFDQLKLSAPGRPVEIQMAEDVTAVGDRGLLRAVLENLLSNAWKYTSKREKAQISFASTPAEASPTYSVRDNGAGFDMSLANKLFQPFQRLHSADEFPGSGVGLTTVQRIIHRHGGRIWAESEPDKGAAFHFTLA
jgi:signal transduction histidine kinase